MSDELFYIWITYPLGTVQMEGGPFDTLSDARIKTADLMKNRHFQAVGTIGTSSSLPPGPDLVRYKLHGSIAR